MYKAGISGVPLFLQFFVCNFPLTKKTYRIDPKFPLMKVQLKLEYISFLLFGILAFARTEYSWWWFAGLFLAPDISMLGYAVNNKVGAFLYNLFHHFGVAVIVYLLGISFALPYLQMTGAILFSHSAFDRILGYGLKYQDSFQHTHLGKIGKNKDQTL